MSCLVKIDRSHCNSAVKIAPQVPTVSVCDDSRLFFSFGKGQRSDPTPCPVALRGWNGTLTECSVCAKKITSVLRMRSIIYDMNPLAPRLVPKGGGYESLLPIGVAQPLGALF